MLFLIVQCPRFNAILPQVLLLKYLKGLTLLTFARYASYDLYLHDLCLGSVLLSSSVSALFLWLC